MIVVIDYKMGNLASVKSKVQRLKHECVVSCDSSIIENASKLIFPGVGHFGEGIKNLRELRLLDVLNRKVIKDKTPILGICLGMQLLSHSSEESELEGLGWIGAHTKKLSFDALQDQSLRVPHVGWDLLERKKDSVLMREIAPETRFYFTHSYAVHCADRSDVVATTTYGYEFDSVIERGNIYGTQFHPEKSHLTGLKIIDNFIKYA